MAPSIKRALNRLGYSGPLTITAVGKLNAPDHVMRALSSSGIALNIVARDFRNIASATIWWARENPPPSNLMLISDNEVYTPTLESIRSQGHNVLRTYPVKCLWRNLLEDAMYSGKRRRQKKCCKPGESALVCSVCDINFTGQGFEAFTKHRWSEKHALEVLDNLPGYGALIQAVTGCPGKDEEMADEAGVEASLVSSEECYYHGGEATKEKVPEEEGVNKTKKKITYMAHGGGGVFL